MNYSSYDYLCCILICIRLGNGIKVNQYSKESRMLSITRGFLLTLEGIDGSGKTTLAAHLTHFLLECGLPVVATREPGQTGLGVHLRALVQERSVPLCPKAEYLLFAANRAQHFDEIVLPQLAKNNIVISDRLADSSLVYQGYARGLDMRMLHTVNAWTMHNRMPDLVIYVRIPVAVACERITKRGGTLSSFEREREQFTHTVCAGYEQLVAGRHDVLIADGLLEPQDLCQDVAKKVMSFMRSQGILQ